MEIIAAGLMVSLTLIVIASRGQGKDTSILWASVLISVSMVLNINPVYLLADGWVGGRNHADLGANLLLLAGVYFLARAIHRAAQPASYGRKSSYDVWAKAGLVGAAISATILFILIDAPVTSTSFMRDYGGQWAAGLYSAGQYLYIGAVMAAAGWTCVRFRKAWTTGIYTVAFALVGLGCLSAVLFVVDVLVLDALHVLGMVEALSALSGIYAVLNSATFLFLCTGMALPPASPQSRCRLRNGANQLGACGPGTCLGTGSSRECGADSGPWCGSETPGPPAQRAAPHDCGDPGLPGPGSRSKRQNRRRGPRKTGQRLRPPRAAVVASPLKAVAWSGLLGAAGALAGAAWAARQATSATYRRRYDIVPLAISDDEIELPATRHTLAPGQFGLQLSAGGPPAVIGPVISTRDGRVTRRLLHRPAGLSLESRGRWSGIVSVDPSSAAADVVETFVETTLGPAPAWMIDRGTDRWAIHVHGQGSARAQTLRGVESASRLGLSSLVISYRNDGEGPRSRDARSHLGESEWRDLEAALRFVAERGGTECVVFGWSLGATMALNTVQRSSLADNDQGPRHGRAGLGLGGGTACQRPPPRVSPISWLTHSPAPSVSTDSADWPGSRVRWRCAVLTGPDSTAP